MKQKMYPAAHILISSISPVLVALCLLLIAGVGFTLLYFVIPSVNAFPLLHIALVVFVFFNIVFNYINCIATSPGTPQAAQGEEPAEYKSTPTYCAKCRISRPPGTHHCRICRTCILQMDHHCVWVNNCVGLYNYSTQRQEYTYGIVSSNLYRVLLVVSHVLIDRMRVWIHAVLHSFL